MKTPGAGRRTGAANFVTTVEVSSIQRHVADVQAQRSAENWFLDAATFAHDGDWTNARKCALRGIEAIGGAP